MKTFFLSLVFNLDFEGKIALRPSKNWLCPQGVQHWRRVYYTTDAMLTKSAQPNKLTVSNMPTLLSLPAMPKDLACCA